MFLFVIYMKLEEKAKKYLDKIKKEDGKINAFLYVNEKVAEEAKTLDDKIEKGKKKGKLYGYFIGVKSNINVKGMSISCASKSLENYYGTYDASAIEKIKKEDGLIIGMTNCDEFASGISGEYSSFGPTKNPTVRGKIPGGSSSGSGAAVAAGFCDAALGSDTGGSVRNPASHCGLIGIKPSYGAVSRHGLIDLSMSLDQIGVLAKNITDAGLVFDVIKGKDEMDTMSFDIHDNVKDEIRELKAGIIRLKEVNPKIQNIIDDKIEKLKEKYKWIFSEVKLEHIDLAIQTYFPMVYSEFFSTTRRIDGRRYGKKIDENSGAEVMRRIFGGSEITKTEFEGEYYRKALEVKAVIAEEFEKVFEKFDFLILPTVPVLPWDIGKADEMRTEEVYAADALTIPMNLAGNCAVSVPAGKIRGIPVGLQICCNKGEDFKMLKIAEMIENMEI